MLAGVLSMLGFMLPYWSVITTVDSTSDGSNDQEVKPILELAVGVWGTCVMIQNRTVGDSLRGFLVQSADSHGNSGAAEATLTCASFFQSGTVGIHCQATHGFSDGKCSRSEHDTPGSLCAAEQPVDMLLDAWEEDQSRGTIRSSDAARKEVTSWLNNLLPDMCSATGNAAAALSAISLMCSSFAIILLLFGVVFDSLESHIVYGGAVSALIAVLIQAALIGVWILETYALHHGNHFGISFKFSVVGSVGHMLAYLNALHHLRLQRDALVELGLLEEDDESLDDIFRTKKLDEELDEKVSGRSQESVRSLESIHSPESARSLSPRKDHTPRAAERVV